MSYLLVIKSINIIDSILLFVISIKVYLLV